MGGRYPVSTTMAASVEWSRISSKLGLSKQALGELGAFRQRAAAARAANAAVKEQKTTVDFEHYRQVLKNKDVVAEGEKLFKSFKVSTTTSRLSSRPSPRSRPRPSLRPRRLP